MAKFTYAERFAHHKVYAPRVVVTVRLDLIEPAAEMIAARMGRLFRAVGGPCYLFVDGQGKARVVHELQPCLQPWLRDKFAELVGCYTKGGGATSLSVELDGLIEDLREHMSP